MMIQQFANLTSREVFVKVRNHLLGQRVRSTNGRGTCTYRGPNGLKCAAGCLIEDDEYTVEIENQPWLAIVALGQADAMHKDLIYVLQRVHDFVEPQDWDQALRYVDVLFGLTDVID
jgi:hypothetical protein